jgi:hypothetical protein
MTKEEMMNIYEEIRCFLRNYNMINYDCSYCCYDVDCSTPISIHFNVDVSCEHNDWTAEWTEAWSIYNDGKIHTENKVYDNIEDFKMDW